MARTKQGRRSQKKNQQVTANVVEEQRELGENQPVIADEVEEQRKLGENQPVIADEVEEQPELGDDGPVEDAEKSEGEIELSEHDEAGAERSRKRKRGPTRMKDIAKDPNNKVRVQFTFMGEPYGSGSVKLSSYLGPLVREHVPVTLTSWTKLSEALKTVLWKSVQARFELDEDYQQKAVLKQLGCLWRSSKSRLVTQILEATNNQQRMNLRPKNVSPTDWRKFVKLKTSQEFKAVSDSYKERRRKQIPHTCSRKGMVRLAEEMKSVSENPSEVTRLKVWVKSRTRKDGTPVDTNAADKMKKAVEMVHSDTPNSVTNEGEDTLTQLLGPDNPGRMRVMGRNMTKTKLACFEVKHKCMTEMQEKQIHLQKKVNELQAEIANLKNQRQEPEVGENSAAKSVNKRAQPKCVLVDWAGTDVNVAEGRIISSEPDDLVNDTRLGPTDVKVLVDSATVPDAFLWRPASNMFTMVEAVGQMIAWPASKCVNLEPVIQAVDITPLGQRASSVNKCKLLDLSSDDVVVAEGRWQTEEPKALVNGLPLGPKVVKVFIDQVHQPETFIWRPTVETTYLEDCLLSFVAWPASKVVFESSRDGTGHKSPFQNSVSTDQTSGGKSVGTASGSMEKSFKPDVTGSKSAARVSKSASEHSPETYPLKQGAEVIKENQKCKLLDISGRKVVVAEGRVHSTDPEQKVHFVRLGSDAARVWVDIVKVDDAVVWKPSDEIETLKDAHGSSIAWPIDKLVIF